MNLFDQNCPKFFAENERADYALFLESVRAYNVGLSEGVISAAFGVDIDKHTNRARITWIMVGNAVRGHGVGKQMMEYTKALALRAGVAVIDIAASHLSAPFFAKYGAHVNREIKDGWGPGMHRVDMEIILQAQ